MTEEIAHDLFESDELVTFWAQHEIKKWVVRVGYYPRGCWVTGTKVTKPKDTMTVYVASRDTSGAARAAKQWVNIIHRWPVAKLLVDHIRLMGKEDL